MEYSLVQRVFLNDLLRFSFPYSVAKFNLGWLRTIVPSLKVSTWILKLK